MDFGIELAFRFISAGNNNEDAPNIVHNALVPTGDALIHVFIALFFILLAFAFMFLCCTKLALLTNVKNLKSTSIAGRLSKNRRKHKLRFIVGFIIAATLLCFVVGVKQGVAIADNQTNEVVISINEETGQIEVLNDVTVSNPYDKYLRNASSYMKQTSEVASISGLEDVKFTINGLGGKLYYGTPDKFKDEETVYETKDAYNLVEPNGSFVLSFDIDSLDADVAKQLIDKNCFTARFSFNEVKQETQFYANGGYFNDKSITEATVNQKLGEKIHFPENDPKSDVARFVSWNTKADGTGETVYDDTVFSWEYTALYAQWSENVVVTFSIDKNTPYGHFAEETVEIKYGTEYEVNGNSIKISGKSYSPIVDKDTEQYLYMFNRWNFDDGQKDKITDEIEFVATLKRATQKYIIQFESVPKIDSGLPDEAIYSYGTEFVFSDNYIKIFVDGEIIQAYESRDIVSDVQYTWTWKNFLLDNQPITPESKYTLTKDCTVKTNYLQTENEYELTCFVPESEFDWGYLTDGDKTFDKVTIKKPYSCKFSVNNNVLTIIEPENNLANNEDEPIITAENNPYTKMYVYSFNSWNRNFEDEEGKPQKERLVDGQEYNFKPDNLNVEADFNRDDYVYYQIDFDMNGYGQQVHSQLKHAGQKIDKPSDPESATDNVLFGGWCVDKDCNLKWNFDDVINSDMILFARWITAENNVAVDGKLILDDEDVGRDADELNPNDKNISYSYIHPDSGELIKKSITTYGDGYFVLSDLPTPSNDYVIVFEFTQDYGWFERVSCRITENRLYNFEIRATLALYKYTLNELIEISNDIAANWYIDQEKPDEIPSHSYYYEEFKRYANNAWMPDGSDNGTSFVQKDGTLCKNAKNHWAIDTNCKTYKEDGFIGDSDNTLQTRIVGINKDFSKTLMSETKNLSSGLTFMATHVLNAVAYYNTGPTAQEDPTWAKSQLKSDLNSKEAFEFFHIPEKLSWFTGTSVKKSGKSIEEGETEVSTSINNFWAPSIYEITGLSPMGAYCDFYNKESVGLNNETSFYNIPCSGFGHLQGLCKTQTGNSTLTAGEKIEGLWTRSIGAMGPDDPRAFCIGLDGKATLNKQVYDIGQQFFYGVAPCFSLCGCSYTISGHVSYSTDEASSSHPAPVISGQKVKGVCDTPVFADYNFEATIDDKGNYIIPNVPRGAVEGLYYDYNFRLSCNLGNGFYAEEVLHLKTGLPACIEKNLNATLALCNYTFDEIMNINEDIASKGDKSLYYFEFNQYMTNGWAISGQGDESNTAGDDNGVPIVAENGTLGVNAKNHWAIDSSGKTLREDGFVGYDDSTLQVRIVGINQNTITKYDENGTRTEVPAGITFMATHSLKNSLIEWGNPGDYVENNSWFDTSSYEWLNSQYNTVPEIIKDNAAFVNVTCASEFSDQDDSHTPITKPSKFWVPSVFEISANEELIKEKPYLFSEGITYAGIQKVIKNNKDKMYALRNLEYTQTGQSLNGASDIWTRSTWSAELDYLYAYKVTSGYTTALDPQFDNALLMPSDLNYPKCTICPCFCLGSTTVKGKLTLDAGATERTDTDAAQKNVFCSYVDPSNGMTVTKATKTDADGNYQFSDFPIFEEDDIIKVVYKSNNGYYGEQNISLSSKSSVIVDINATLALCNYSLQGLIDVSNDLAKNYVSKGKNNSVYFKEFSEYMNKGNYYDEQKKSYTGEDNGSPMYDEEGNLSVNKENHWAIDKNNRTARDYGFDNNSENTLQVRIAGLCQDVETGFINDEASITGITFMATHSLDTAISYSDDYAKQWKESNVREVLNNSISDHIASGVVNNAISVRKSYGLINEQYDQVSFSDDKFWAASEHELLAMRSGQFYDKEGTGLSNNEQYDAFVKKVEDVNIFKNIYKKQNGSSWANADEPNVWTRSFVAASILPENVYSINNGAVNIDAYNKVNAICPCFSFGSARPSGVCIFGNLIIPEKYKRSDFASQATVEYKYNDPYTGESKSGQFSTDNDFNFVITDLPRASTSYNVEFSFHYYGFVERNVVCEVDTYRKDFSITAQQESPYLAYYTLNELVNACRDIRSKYDSTTGKSTSQLYDEFVGYCENGLIKNNRDRIDNGQPIYNSEGKFNDNAKNHWGIDKNGVSSGEEGYLNNDDYTINVRIIGVLQDRMASKDSDGQIVDGGVGGVTFMTTHRSMQNSSVNIYSDSKWGWAKSILRKTMNSSGTGVKVLDKYVLPIKKASSISGDGGNLETNIEFTSDKFWVPSTWEVTARNYSTYSADKVAKNEGTGINHNEQYQGFVGIQPTDGSFYYSLGSLGKKQSGDGSVDKVWLRSHCIDQTAYSFHKIISPGTTASHYDGAENSSNSLYYNICFCL